LCDRSARGLRRLFTPRLSTPESHKLLFTNSCWLGATTRATACAVEIETDDMEEAIQRIMKESASAKHAHIATAANKALGNRTNQS
jgi:hypothetical protein